MKTGPYSQINNDELILRDRLAADRTVLANERTLLSYVRTALAFAAAGAALVHFFESAFVEIVGWTLIAVAFAILAIGVQRYLRMRHRLASLTDKTPPPGP